jgi:hypothetical protein
VPRLSAQAQSQWRGAGAVLSRVSDLTGKNGHSWLRRSHSAFSTLLTWALRSRSWTFSSLRNTTDQITANRKSATIQCHGRSAGGSIVLLRTWDRSSCLPGYIHGSVCRSHRGFCHAPLIEVFNFDRSARNKMWLVEYTTRLGSFSNGRRILHHSVLMLYDANERWITEFLK